MRVVVQHRSRYYYPRPALLGPQLIRLRPDDHTRVRIESYQLLVEPEHRLHWLRDPHGNRVARVTFKAGQADEHDADQAVDSGPACVIQRRRRGATPAPLDAGVQPH